MPLVGDTVIFAGHVTVGGVESVLVTVKVHMDERDAVSVAVHVIEVA